MNHHEWHSAETDEPGDQQRDLRGHFWAEVGPDRGATWSWTIFETTEHESVTLIGGRAATEQIAKDAIARWEAGNAPPTTYNVLVGVVGLIEANSEIEAIKELERRVQAAGLDLYEGDNGPGTSIPHAFESDIGIEENNK